MSEDDGSTTLVHPRLVWIPNSTQWDNEFVRRNFDAVIVCVRAGVYVRTCVCGVCVCVTIVPCALMNRVVAQVSSSHLMFRMGPKTHSWSRSLLHMKRPVPPHVYHAQEGPFMSRNE